MKYSLTYTNPKKFKLMSIAKSYDPDVANYFTRIDNKGDSFTFEEEYNFNNFIKQLKSAGLYHLHDVFVICGQRERETSKLNIISQYTTDDIWIEKCEGRTIPQIDSVFYSIRELSNGDLLAGCGIVDGHYYRSTDKGETWIDQGQINASVTAVYDFCDLGIGIVLCAGSVQARMGRSTDYGYTWTFSDILYSQDYLTLLINLKGGRVVCACENSPTPNVAIMLYSDDYGLTWSSKATGCDITVINMLCNLGNGILIAGGGKDMGAGVFIDGHIIRSTDYGQTWTDIGIIDATQTRFFGSTYLGNGRVIIGSSPDGHIFGSDDYGLTWEDYGIPVSGYKEISALVNLGEGKIIGIAIVDPANGVIIRSDDYGRSWVNLGILESGQNPGCLFKDINGNYLTGCATNGATPGKIFKSSTDFFERQITNNLNITEVANGGTLLHTSKEGFNSDGTNSYLKSNLIPSSILNRGKLNDRSFWFLCSGTSEVTGYHAIGGQNAAGNRLDGFFNNMDTSVGTCYLHNVVTAGSQLWGIGYNCISRLPDGSFKQFININSYDLTGVPVEMVDKELFLLCLHEFPNPNYWMGANIRLRAYGSGRGMTQTQFNNLKNILDTYLLSL